MLPFQLPQFQFNELPLHTNPNKLKQKPKETGGVSFVPLHLAFSMDPPAPCTLNFCAALLLLLLLLQTEHVDNGAGYLKEYPAGQETYAHWNWNWMPLDPLRMRRFFIFLGFRDRKRDFIGRVSLC